MKYDRLIGFKIDTNQFTSKIIETASEAKQYINKATSIYGEDILIYMFLSGDKFSTFSKTGINLYNFLTK